MQPLTLHVEGMSCGHCLNAVNQALAKLDGVEVGTVQMGRATLRYDPSRVSPETIADAIGAAGYRAVPAEA